MFWVASLSLIYAPALVVPIVLALEVLASVTLVPSVLDRIQWRSMVWMLAATVATMPIGVVLLSTLPAREMRAVVALAILTGAVAMGRGLRLKAVPGRGLALSAGTVSGLVNGSTGIGGPPAVLLYFSAAQAYEVTRATLIAYFLCTDAIGFAMMAAAGLVDRQVLLQTALFTPLALGGVVVGQILFGRTGGRGFRSVVLTVLIALAAAMLLRVFLVG